MTHKLIKTDNYLLVVDDLEIKEGDNCLCDISAGDYFGVVAYNGAFAEHYYKKIIAHLPLNGSSILEGVPLLPPIEDDVEQLAKVEYPVGDDWDDVESLVRKLAFKKGYNKAKEKYNNKLKEIIMQFDLEIKKHLLMYSIEHSIHGKMCDGINEIRSSILQSLHQYPTEFETEDVLTPSQIFYPNDVPYCSPKTIITAQGVQWVGKYK